MEDSLLNRRIAKVGDCNMAPLGSRQCPGNTSGNRKCARENRGRTLKTHRSINEVLASPSSSAATGRLAMQFGDHPVEIPAFGQVVAVTPMSAHCLIFNREMGRHPNAGCFLPDTKMNWVAHLLVGVPALNCLLHPSNAQHVEEGLGHLRHRCFTSVGRSRYHDASLRQSFTVPAALQTSVSVRYSCAGRVMSLSACASATGMSPGP